MDHQYEPGDYGVCRRCGQEKHEGRTDEPKELQFTGSVESCDQCGSNCIHFIILSLNSHGDKPEVRPPVGFCSGQCLLKWFLGTLFESSRRFDLEAFLLSEFKLIRVSKPEVGQ